MYELQVEGMTCNHCVSKVTRSVKGVDATATVDVDLKTRTVRIESAAELQDISAAIDEVGYAVSDSKVS